ncbi:MAG: tetratricopeptide repeat protein [bacterium]
MRSFLMKNLVVGVVLAMILGCGRMPDERLMEKGAQFENDGEYVEAIDCYEKLVKHYQKSPFIAEALYRAGLAYSNGLQDFSKAVTSLQRVVDEFPDSKPSAQCQFMIGFIYANSAPDTAKARVAYNAFLEKFPNHELASAVHWELEHLGKDINEIPELAGLDKKPEPEAEAEK